MLFTHTLDSQVHNNVVLCNVIKSLKYYNLIIYTHDVPNNMRAS